MVVKYSFTMQIYVMNNLKIYINLSIREKQQQIEILLMVELEEE